MAYELATKCKNLKCNNYCPIRIILENSTCQYAHKFFNFLVLDGENSEFQVSQSAFLKMIS